MVLHVWPLALLRAAGTRCVHPFARTVLSVGIRRFLPALNSRLHYQTLAMSDHLHCDDVATKKRKYDEPGPVPVAGLRTTWDIADDVKNFDKMFETLLDDLSHVEDPVTSDALRWLRRVCQYNVPYGKKNRGLTVVHSYRYLAADSCTDDGVRLAMVLGWCVEWLQAFFLVADDVMDQSLTRRGQPCWYKNKDVGLIAVNDSFFLESSIYVLLKKYFRQLPYYVDILDLFRQTTLQTVIGQNLDLITAPTDRVDFTAYTMERYNAIVKYKTAFYSFYLPVACAMYMNGISDKETHDHARAILLKMGEYFQIQDDFLDCYGDPEVTGKVGTDIEDNKCSWLVVQALQLASTEQRHVLEANYGRHDAECVAKVKSIFSELKLEKLYADYEEQSYVDIQRLVDEHCGCLPREMFLTYARKIYKRQK